MIGGNANGKKFVIRGNDPIFERRLPMFQPQARRTTTRTMFGMLELIYHSIVRDVRRTHSNALVGLAMNILQTVMLVITFYAMFYLLGMRGNAIRGDFLLYIMSGIFLFQCHTKALSTLYLQLLSLFCVLFIYHVMFTPLVIEYPIGAMAMLLAAWLTGVGIGMVFLAIKPWAPNIVKLMVTIYTRGSMIASGKMFVANSLPASMLVLFDWNPLFHTIDQARGYIFLHYNPHFSSSTYPYFIAVCLLVLGMMGEFFTHRSASLSWSAGR